MYKNKRLDRQFFYPMDKWYFWFQFKVKIQNPNLTNEI